MDGNDNQGTGDVSSQGAAPAPDTTVVGNTGVSADIGKMLAFDPFESGKDLNPTSKDGDKGAPQDASKDGADGATSKPATPAPAAQPNPADQDLQKTVKQLQDQLAAIQAGNAPQGQPQGQPQPQGQDKPQGQPQDNIPDYMFTFPDPLIQALNSEDPRDQRVGLTTLARGVARGIHQTVMNEIMTKVMPQIMDGAVRQVQQRAMIDQEVHNMRTDFYGAYKEYDKPELKPIISNIAMQLAKETNTQGWNAQFRDQLAERVKGFLKTLNGTPMKSPAMTGGAGGARPAPNPADNVSKEIMDLF